ncbi:MAG: hypothetical protein ACKN9Z_03015, partial [Actinomycetota bacterium]
KPRTSRLGQKVDIPLPDDLHIKPNELVQVDLGIKIKIPTGYFGLLEGKRTARDRYGIQIYLGLIDIGFKDFLQVVVQNMTMEEVFISEGVAICKLTLLKTEYPKMVETGPDLIDRDWCVQANQTRQSVPFELKEEKNQLLALREVVDTLDPKSFTVGFTEVKLLGTTEERIRQLEELRDLEYSQMTGSSVNMVANLPNLHVDILEDCEKERSADKPDPDNFRSADGKLPDLNQREMSALLAADFADSAKLTAETLANLQNAEKRLREIKESLIGDPDSHANFVLKNGILCRRYTIQTSSMQFLGVYIPTSILYAVVIYIHKHFLHPSKTQTLKEFQNLYYHPFVKKAVQKVCDSCLVCTQSRNQSKTETAVGRSRTLKPTKPREAISMDVLYLPASSRGHKYGLIISDLYSLYISFYPMKSKSSAEIAKHLRTYFAAQCPPEAVYSDSDPCFRGEVENLFRVYKINHLTSYPFTQRENYVESQVRIFKNAYRAAILDNPVFKLRDWDTLYPLVVCRINCMISKYGMSREAMHYGDIVESALPIITDTEVYGPLESDLERVQNMFRDRMGRFMQKRRKNKLYYKLGKAHKFYINELVMYKVYTPKSMLHPTYTGPARIIDLSPKGATLRDPKTGSTFSVSFDNLRKISFEELLSLLPQNFDAEIAETLGTYRYRRMMAEPEQEPETTVLGEDADPQEGSDPELGKGQEEFNPTAPRKRGRPRKTEKQDAVQTGEQNLVKEQAGQEHDPDSRKTRSGKLFNIKPAQIPKKIRGFVQKATLRRTTVPKSVCSKHELPMGPCLKRRYEQEPFVKPEPAVGTESRKTRSFSKSAIEKFSGYKEEVPPSIFQSEESCTKKFILKQNAQPNRVKFGTITVFFV